MLCLDCYTLARCNGRGSADIVPCPTATPYCQEATSTCATKADPYFDICQEQELEKDLSCTMEGYFPDPLDCRTYYFCPDPAIKPVVPRKTYTCPANYVYDSKTHLCKKQVFAKDCVSMVCTKDNSFLTYPGNANYYGFCKPSVNTPIMFKCPDGHNFNLSTFGCEFTCPGLGYFPGPTCRQSYLCWMSGTKIVAQLESCPKGYLWSGTCQLDTKGQCTA